MTKRGKKWSFKDKKMMSIWPKVMWTKGKEMELKKQENGGYLTESDIDKSDKKWNFWYEKIDFKDRRKLDQSWG